MTEPTIGHAEAVDVARAERDAGIEAATNAADPRVALAIDAAIALANASGEPWSANDIRDQFPTCSSGLVGARVRAATMRRPVEMEVVGTTPSTLASTHAKDIKVYRGVADADRA